MRGAFIYQLEVLDDLCTINKAHAIRGQSLFSYYGKFPVFQLRIKQCFIFLCNDRNLGSANFFGTIFNSFQNYK